MATSRGFAIQTLMCYESIVHNLRHIEKKIDKEKKRRKNVAHYHLQNNLDLQAFTNIGITHHDLKQ